MEEMIFLKREEEEPPLVVEPNDLGVGPQPGLAAWVTFFFSPSLSFEV